MSQQSTLSAAKSATLERKRKAYVYLPRDVNQLYPVCTPKSWPWREEQYGPSWALPFLPGYLGAYLNEGLKRVLFRLQRMIFRFDKVRAYGQLFNGALPEYATGAGRDDHFAWRRIAGPNPLSLQRENDLKALLGRIPFDVERVERRLAERMGQRVSLAALAGNGQLFACDFKMMQESLRPQSRPTYLSHGPAKRTRDSRWRGQYLPAPIGVFVELPGFYTGIDLVPLAIQIDQHQPSGEYNPVYYPDDQAQQGWGWTIAKLYFETADEVFHAGCGHVLRTHLTMNAFCMATPRQLPEDHPVYVLLRPHTRFTLPANKAVYKDYVDRTQIYAEFYSGKLDEFRAFSKLSYEAKRFDELALCDEVKGRGVDEHPKVYPYRDDALLWVQPIRDFVGEFLGAFYADDAAVLGDAALQAWAAELVDPDCGGVRGLVAGDALDTRAKLFDLLAHVLFVAGPGHASQHFAEMYYYRYPPAFVGAAFAPPPWQANEANAARWYRTLPSIDQAATQFTYSTFGNFQYDTFGHYDRYPLGSAPQAREPIRKLQAALQKVEGLIAGEAAQRPLRYDFLLPSRVPNSINI